MHTGKALWIAGTLALAAFLIAPAQACDKSGTKAAAGCEKSGVEIGQASVIRAGSTQAGANCAQAASAGCTRTASASCIQAGSAGCTRTASASCIQAGSAACASACGAASVKKAQASACTGTFEDCARMMRAEYATRGWLGVELQWSDGRAEPTVTAVVPGSPADRAGFRAGDVMTSMSGISFAPAHSAVLNDFMANAYTIGKTVRYTVMRKGEIIRLNPTLVEIPSEQLDRMVAGHKTAQHAADVASAVK